MKRKAEKQFDKTDTKLVESKGKLPFKRNFKQKLEEVKVPKICMNDPNWYVIHPELLKDVATLPFSHWLGDGLPLRFTSTTGSVAHEATILKLLYTYTLGVANEANDPVNLAIRNLYTYVRHQNSGHTNYEPADLGMYLLATGTLIASLAHIERCLGTIKLYQKRSRVVPQQLCDALGINLANSAANLANYTARLNILWQRVSSLCIPKDFKFIQRWIWMNSQVFKDHDSDKAALIVFKPIGVPQFDATSSARGGIIKQYTSEMSTPDLVNWFLDAESLANSILEDEDMNIMSGDILKAYGFENCMQFGMTSLDYTVEPVYVEEMLPQVQHAMTLLGFNVSGQYYGLDAPRTGIPYSVAAIINDQTDPLYTIAQDDDYFTIYQVDGTVVCAPVQKGLATAASVDSGSGTLYWATFDYLYHSVANDQVLLSSYKKDVPPEDVIISTRLMYTESLETRVSTSNGNPVFIESCGTELVGKFVVYYSYKNPSGLIGKGSHDFTYRINSDSSGFPFHVTQEVSQIDWAPFMYADAYSAGTLVRNSLFYGDIDNFTALYPETLAMMHTNAILAEFNVTKYNLIN